MEGPLVNRHGALVLSRNAGAYGRLGKHALTVNPFDIRETADAIRDALEMPEEERKRRARGLSRTVQAHTPPQWLASQLEALDSVRPPRELTALERSEELDQRRGAVDDDVRRVHERLRRLAPAHRDLHRQLEPSVGHAPDRARRTPGCRRRRPPRRARRGVRSSARIRSTAPSFNGQPGRHQLQRRACPRSSSIPSVAASAARRRSSIRPAASTSGERAVVDRDRRPLRLDPRSVDVDGGRGHGGIERGRDRARIEPVRPDQPHTPAPG